MTWNELRSPAWSLSLPSLVVSHFVSETVTFDNLLYQESQCEVKAHMILLFVAQLMRTIEASWSSSCRRRIWSAVLFWNRALIRDRACVKKNFDVYLKGSRKWKTDLLSSDLSWLKTKGRAIAEKFYDEIIRLKKVCIYMDVIVERLRPLFL